MARKTGGAQMRKDIEWLAKGPCWLKVILISKQGQ